MAYRFPIPTRALLLLAALALAACDTAEERAEAHYQRGMALLAEGDPDRAILEFRNVFRLNGEHAAARTEFARLLAERGNLREAVSQYLRLVNQDWQNAEAHRQLAELALRMQDFATARTHADAAFGIDPASPEGRALKATIEFRDGDRAAALAMARELLAEDPGNIPANLVLVADRLEAGEPAAALALLDAAEAHAPGDESLALARLGVLERVGDRAAIGAQLAAMAAQFPENGGVRQALYRWHIGEGDLDAAEAMLRENVAASPGDTDAQLNVVWFLMQRRGPEAARAELERLIAGAADPAPFRRVLAGLEASEGRTDAAVAILEELIAGSEPSDARRDAQIDLARIRTAQGDAAARDALLDAVLAEDERHVEALKLRAGVLIDADRPEEAIRALRTALDEAPEDAAILTLMAGAHEREGARELAGERLALAVEVSGRAPAESIRYATFLLQDDRVGPAEAVVVDALRRAPEDRDLLALLGRIHLARRDWTRAEQVVEILRRQDDPEAAEIATGLEAELLRGQDRYDETIALLKSIDGGGDAALAGVVETYLQADDLAGARRYVDQQVAEAPGDLAARTLQAGLTALAGDPAAAETGYRAIIAEAADYLPAHRALFGLLAAQGRAADAAAALEAGLAATSDAPDLLFVKAGLLERQGDFEGAIAIYERLYAQNSASPVIANNLASLITTHRDDPASLERAFAVARRLRGTEVPQFQDTYGWILARRGDHAEALSYLEPAAGALPDDPLVQFHLGVTQYRLDRRPDARASLERALAAAGPDSALPQLAEARALLAELAAAPEANN